MYELLSQSQQSELTGIFGNHFKLFGGQSNNFITVIKAPVQLINNPNEDVLPGYGAVNMDVTSITYDPPITGVFPAIIIYPHTMNSAQFGGLKFDIDDNQIMIKVESDAKHFIKRGIVERIVVDGQSYNPEYSHNVQSFLGLEYYYFKLTITK